MPALPQVTKSNGGVMSAELGKVHCAQMIMSGTAAGVIGAKPAKPFSTGQCRFSADREEYQRKV